MIGGTEAETEMRDQGTVDGMKGVFSGMVTLMVREDGDTRMEEMMARPRGARDPHSIMSIGIILHIIVINTITFATKNVVATS